MLSEAIDSAGDLLLVRVHIARSCLSGARNRPRGLELHAWLSTGNSYLAQIGICVQLRTVQVYLSQRTICWLPKHWLSQVHTSSMYAN